MRPLQRLIPQVQLLIPQVAELLRTSEAQVHRWIRDRGLPATLFGEQYRLNRVSVLSWAQQNQVPFDATAMPVGPSETSIATALLRGGIHRDVPGATPAEVLINALERVHLPAAVDLELLREMVLSRAERGMLSIGDGLAMPHARYPFVAEVPEPLLGLCFLATAVDFGPDEHTPVSTLFVVVSPSVRTHLQLVARLARALASSWRSLVLARASDATILAAAATDATANEAKP